MASRSNKSAQPKATKRKESVFQREEREMRERMAKRAAAKPKPQPKRDDGEMGSSIRKTIEKVYRELTGTEKGKAPHAGSAGKKIQSVQERKRKLIEERTGIKGKSYKKKK